MNLETAIDPRLWESIRLSVEARRFTPAVLDAIHFLTDTIRDRSGLEGDGLPLIGEAFGGATPKLKVNRLQTDSERNIQKGVESLLRGLYQAVRNPRSHESFDDSEQDARALILFVDFLLRTVDKTASPFSLVGFLDRVFDPDFVPSSQYAKLLVSQIPVKRRLEVCREVFGNRQKADRSKIKHFFSEILGELSPDDHASFCEIVSDELQQSTDDSSIIFVVDTLPTIWPKLSELARLRCENKMIDSAKKGAYVRRLGRCNSGTLGTWIPSILPAMMLQRQLWSVVFWRLQTGSEDAVDYMLQYFAGRAEAYHKAPPMSLVDVVKKGIDRGDIRFKNLAERWAGDFLEDKPIDHPWRQPFVESLQQFEESTTTAREEEDIPF